jgi:hypothetical protein
MTILTHAFQKTLLGACLIVACASSCAVEPGVSDVPCLRPVEWGTAFFDPLVQADENDPSYLLFTRQNWEEYDADRADGSFDGQPHGPVYKFDSSTGEFVLVEDSLWDDLDGPLGGPSFPEGSREGFRTPAGRLEFDGRRIPVAGGYALGTWGAIEAPVVAVLSTDGGVGVPFIGTGAVGGQHYHQLFSTEDGSSVGPAVRLGVGGLDKGMVKMLWSPEDRFVIYYQHPLGGSEIDLLCVVDVGDQIDQLEVVEP